MKGTDIAESFNMGYCETLEDMGYEPEPRDYDPNLEDTDRFILEAFLSGQIVALKEIIHRDRIINGITIKKSLQIFKFIKTHLDSDNEPDKQLICRDHIRKLIKELEEVHNEGN